MIYLDNHATTPVDPRVREAMVRAMGPEFANPGSTSHAPGRAAAAAVARAREQIAALLNAQPSEIVFTSGATEANNLALLGAVRRHVITTQIEHPAVLETVEHLTPSHTTEPASAPHDISAGRGVSRCPTAAEDDGTT